jgi:hypothetical protein
MKQVALGILVIAISVVPCAAQQDRPDPTLTPGAINSGVTQANIKSTICVRGYTKTIRPPARYTTALKRQQIKQYGFSDKKLSDYEEDHLVSLELGGHPTDPAKPLARIVQYTALECACERPA